MKPGSELMMKGLRSIEGAVWIERDVPEGEPEGLWLLGDTLEGYIVHACNAYPRLVEALEDALDLLLMNGSFRAESFKRKARALLAELGE